jgi:hypothetical protein
MVLDSQVTLSSRLVGGVMRTIGSVGASLIVVAACAPLPRDPLNLRWDPDAALMTHSASECWLHVAPADESVPAIDAFQQQRADIQTCIDALPEDDRIVVFFDSPGGNPILRGLVSTPDGIPVELRDNRDGWQQVRIESGISAWVEREAVALLDLD